MLESEFRNLTHQLIGFLQAKRGRRFHDAEDLAQAAFLRAIKSPPKRNRKAFLETVALRLSDSSFRRERRFRSLEPSDSIVHVTRSEHVVYRAEDLRAAILRLKPRERAVAICKLRGKSMEEIAARLGVCLRTANFIWQSARQRLRQLLDNPPPPRPRR